MHVVLISFFMEEIKLVMGLTCMSVKSTSVDRKKNKQSICPTHSKKTHFLWVILLNIIVLWNDPQCTKIIVHLAPFLTKVN